MTDRAYIHLSDRADPLLLVWPMPGDPAALVQFAKAAEWRRLIDGLAIDVRAPAIVQATFAHARRLHQRGWIDFGLVKAGELAGLIALDMAMMNHYGGRISKRKSSFATLLAHMVVVDGLADADIPMVARCGRTAIGQLTGEVRASLAESRNALAHGDHSRGSPPATCSNWSATSSTLPTAITLPRPRPWVSAQY